MNTALPVLVGIGALMGELFVREAFALDAWSPDLLSAVVLWIGGRRSWIHGAVLAAALGAIADGFAGSPLGLHMLHAVLLFYAAAALGNQVRFQGVVGYGLLGLVGGFVSLFLLVVVARVFMGDTLLAARVGSLIVPRVVVVTLAVPFTFAFLDRIDTVLTRRIEGDVL